MALYFLIGGKIFNMKKYIFIIAIIILAFQILSVSYCESEESQEEVKQEWLLDEELQERIENYLKERTGNYSFYVIDPKTKEYVSINDSKYIAASIIKTYLLVETHRQIKEGNLSFEDKLPPKDTYKVDGSGIIGREDDGTKYTIRELLDLVITISDNVAANMLADHIGLENINNTMKEFAIEDSNYGHLILRKEKTRYFYGWNRTTTKDLATMYYHIYTRQCLGEEYDNMLIELFTKCRSNYKIPKLLPEGTKVSHKTGSLSLYEHDAGIVFSENRDYIIACMSDNLKSNKEGQRTIANVSKIVYNHMMEKDKKERSGYLKLLENKIFIKGEKFSLYDFKGEKVVWLEEILRANLVLERDENGEKLYLYQGDSENLCGNNYGVFQDKSASFNFNDIEAVMERKKIDIGKKNSNIIVAKEGNFIFVKDLEEIGKVKTDEDDNYHMDLYAGNVLKPDKNIFISGQEIVAYDVDGEIYIPLGYYYSFKSDKSGELIKKYTDYLKKRSENYNNDKAEYVKFDYKNDIEKFDILSIGGNIVINIEEIR